VIPPPAFCAAVLCGGASRRLGVDKAGVRVDGVPLALGVAEVARAAGAVRVAGVGARPAVQSLLVAAGVEAVDDRWPGAGPAAATVTALSAVVDDPSATLLVVLGCDYPRLRRATLTTLVSALADRPDVAALVAEAGGRRHPTVSVWRVPACLGLAEAYLAAGGRSLTGLADAVGALGWAVPEAELADVDTPADLAALRFPTDRV